MRALADEVGRARGRRIEIGAKVLPSREGNLAQGLDAATWVQEDCSISSSRRSIRIGRSTQTCRSSGSSILRKGRIARSIRRFNGRIRGLDLAEDRVSPRALDLHAGLDHLRAGAASYWDRERTESTYFS